MQRWALILAAYSYELEFQRTEEYGNADALSRVPVSSKIDSSVGFPPDNFYHFEFFQTGITFVDVQRETKADPKLSRVVNKLLDG